MKIRNLSPGLTDFDFCHNMQKVGPKFGTKHHESTDSAFRVSAVRASGGGVMFWVGECFLSTY